VHVLAVGVSVLHGVWFGFGLVLVLVWFGRFWERDSGEMGVVWGETDVVLGKMADVSCEIVVARG
jgi:hypothetical protein